MYHEFDQLYPHANACTACTYLGSHETWDLYFCHKHGQFRDGPLLVAFSSPNDHITAHADSKPEHPALAVAYDRAREERMLSA